MVKKLMECFKLNKKNEIIFLDVMDENISYIKTENTEMYAKKIEYNKET